MSKGMMFRQALRLENWGEAERLVLNHPELVLREDARGKSFVAYATFDGRWAAAEWLLQRGACWNAAIGGWLEGGASAPLAFEASMVGKLKVLLKSDPGAEFAVVLNKLTMLAIKARRADVLSLLVAVESATEGDQWPSQWRQAIKRFDLRVCSVLMATNVKKFNDKNFLSELGSLAVAVNNLDALCWLSLNGLDVNHLDANGRAMLGVAAALGREKVCLWLCEKGALVDLKDAAGRTALCAAVIHGRGGCARELVRLGADPELRQGLKGQGDSPLRLAAKDGAKEMRRILVPQLEKVVMSTILPLTAVRQDISRRL